VSNISRRTFFQGAALAVSASRVMGANDKINVGIVGLGTRGPALLGYLVKIPEARVAGLCRRQAGGRERTQALLQQLAPGEKAKEFVDMREMSPTKPSTPCFFPCRSIGTGWPRCGAAKRAKTCTSRSRPATTSTRAGA